MWCRRLADDEAACGGWPAHGVPPLRRGDAEGVALGDGLAQQVDERGADAGVGDAPEVSSNFIILLRDGGVGISQSNEV